MSNTKEIKAHIKSVRDTQKITNAMYLIASIKLRKARNDLQNTRPYFEAVKEEIKRVFRTVKDVESRYFYPMGVDDVAYDAQKTCACLVITGDKGLAGAYNQNVVKKAMEVMDAHAHTRLYVIGERGRQFFTGRDIPIERSFLYTAQNPTFRRARIITSNLLDLYDAGEVGEIYVVYTDMKNALESETICTRLLPLHRGQFTSPVEEKGVLHPFEFHPSEEAVLDSVIPPYLAGFTYSAMVASFCAEQSARMNAMYAANTNAEGILEDLTLQYNRARQAAITQEITEVSSGAKAQTRKHNSAKEASQP